MGNVTASTLQTLLHLTSTSLPDITCEAIIDQAINSINLRGRTDLPNMGGTSGSKTVGLTSREEGAVLEVATIIYSNMYVASGSESSSYGIGAVSTSLSSASANMAIKSAAQEAARSLAEIEVDVG